MGAVEVLILAAMGVIPAGLIGGLVIYAQRERARRVDAWTQTARALGLHYINDQIVGVLSGQRIQLRLVTRGSGNSQATYTVIDAGVVPPFDLGLSASKESYFGSAFNAMFGRHDIPTGDVAFDAQFHVRGDEPHRVQAALTPDVRRALLHLAQGMNCQARDGGVHAEVNEVVKGAPRAQWMLQATARAAAALAAARPHVPVASSLAATHDAWCRYANGVGLQTMATPLCLWGSLDGHDVLAYAVRVEGMRYELEMRVRFATPLGLGLKLRPKRTYDSLATLFGGQDIKTGHESFDDDFIVQGADAERIKLALTKSVREKLMELHDRHLVSVDDDGLNVRTKELADPRTVPRLLAEAAPVLEEMASAVAGKKAQRGAYR